MKLTILVSLTLFVITNAFVNQNCDGVEDGIYPIGPCEDRFLTCSGGIARIMDCPADLIYNHPQRLCDWRYNVLGCESGEIEESGEESGEASGEESGEASGEESGEASGEESGEASGEESGEYSGEASGEASGESSGEASGEASGEEMEVVIIDDTFGSSSGDDLVEVDEVVLDNTAQDYYYRPKRFARSAENVDASGEESSGSEEQSGEEGESSGYSGEETSGDISDEEIEEELINEVARPFIFELLRFWKNHKNVLDSPQIIRVFLKNPRRHRHKHFETNEEQTFEYQPFAGVGKISVNENDNEGTNVCAEQEDGIYSLETCTNTYTVCIAHEARSISCPTPLYFDAVNERCDWKHSIVACTSGEESSGEGSGQEESSGEGSGESEPSCEGKTDGIYAINECSTQFFYCSAGIVHITDCPATTVFNPAIFVCDWERNVVGCQNIPTPKPICEEDGYYSFGQCSSTFTACTNGRQIVKYCPAGLKFSQANVRCDYPLEVEECNSGEESGSAESSGEASGESSGEQSGEEEGSGDVVITSCDNHADGLYGIGCTSSVFSCHNGQISFYECPSSLVFNEHSSTCDYPQTSLKCLLEDPIVIETSEEEDCSLDGWFTSTLCSNEYYQCIDGVKVNFKCENSHSIFSVLDAECVDRSTVKHCH